jgi:hypothetical protein
MAVSRKAAIWLLTTFGEPHGQSTQIRIFPRRSRRTVRGSEWRRRRTEEFSYSPDEIEAEDRGRKGKTEGRIRGPMVIEPHRIRLPYFEFQIRLPAKVGRIRRVTTLVGVRSRPSSLSSAASLLSVLLRALRGKFRFGSFGFKPGSAAGGGNPLDLFNFTGNHEEPAIST